MNPYVHINRIEFPITYACTGRCRHCSAAGRDTRSHIHAEAAAQTVREVAREYDVSSIMTFGGEPLLYPDAVLAIHTAAREAGIPKRQIITNGCFTKDEQATVRVAKQLADASVNSILLSVDAFHAEWLDMDRVYLFAKTLMNTGAGGVTLSPAWLGTADADNEWNAKTRALLNRFTDLGIPEGDGNVIFAAGNAVKNFPEYFEPTVWQLSDPCGSQPYSGRPDSVTTLSVDPDGSIMICSFKIGNIIHTSAVKVLSEYDPYAREDIRAVLTGGVPALLRYAETRGITVDPSRYRSACGVCNDIVRLLQAKS